MSDQEKEAIEEIEEVKEESPPTESIELAEYKNKYLRTLADMENMRKRMQKERQEMTKFSVENVISEFLQPLDGFENALGFTAHMSEETKNWAKGFEMILSQFKEVLNAHGVTPFTSEGSQFDPHLHEAVEMQETEEVSAGTIIKELMRGYKCGDRVLRAARVIVAKAPAAEEDEEPTITENMQSEE